MRRSPGLFFLANMTFGSFSEVLEVLSVENFYCRLYDRFWNQCRPVGDDLFDLWTTTPQTRYRRRTVEREWRNLLCESIHITSFSRPDTHSKHYFSQIRTGI